MLSESRAFATVLDDRRAVEQKILMGNTQLTICLGDVSQCFVPNSLAVLSLTFILQRGPTLHCGDHHIRQVTLVNYNKSVFRSLHTAFSSSLLLDADLMCMPRMDEDWPS